MRFTPQQYAKALFDSIAETNTEDHEAVLDNFVKVLAANGDLAKFEEIESAYNDLDREAKGIRGVDVTFAREINPKILDELNTVVQDRAEFKTKVDEGIVGGVVLKADEILIDGSLRTQLEDLNKMLKGRV
ncbi:MAG: F0F1 ATP synthase subunit delta [Candidatus Doudnabacteria bacterium]|nr:F0F1 ATP synthase subunit delta [bacterium]MDZ4243958.1 F0F1 ATP synthase subunit delta [Candidatus Doudnabacteria bacterium]